MILEEKIFLQKVENKRYETVEMCLLVGFSVIQNYHFIIFFAFPHNSEIL